MKKGVLFSALILALSVFGSITAQEVIELPEFKISPNYPLVNKELDSVIKFTYATPYDSSQLIKWEYNYIDSAGYFESLQHTWVKTQKKWLLRSKYNYSYDSFDRLTLLEHYDWFHHGIWYGCDSEGCGKREWRYDSTGNQTLWTQAYWDSHERDWRIDDHWETEQEYDKSGNLTRDIIKTFSGFSWEDRWDGHKDEYSYTASGIQLGHVNYSWAGGDPYDWFPYRKTEMKYDSSDRLIMKAFYEWNGDQWIGVYWSYWLIPSCKATWNYGSDGKISLIKLYFWNQEKNDWSLTLAETNVYNAKGQPEYEIIVNEWNYQFRPEKHEYDYNLRGDRIANIRTLWDVSYNPSTGEYEMGWSDKSKTEYSYYQNGKVKSVENSYWREEEGGWRKNDKSEYVYDDYGRTTEIIHWYGNWDSDDWQQDSKIEYNYDIYDRTIMETRYYWNRQINDWQLEYMWERNYNSLGLILLFASFNWSEEYGIMVGSIKREYQYDDSGRLLMEAHFVWDRERNKWIGDNWSIGDREEVGMVKYEYNDSGLITLCEYYQWSMISSCWKGSKETGKREWDYNSNGIPVSEIQYKWDEDLKTWIKYLKKVVDYDNDSDPLVQHQYSWNTGTGVWDIVIREQYFYQKTSSIRKYELSAIDIFPNPTSGLVNITGLTAPAEAKIYSLQGQLLKSYHQVDTSIDLSGLQPGVYILNIQAGNQVTVTKIMLL